MNEIHGFGSLQPLRPTGAPRIQAPATTPEVLTPEFRDEVSLPANLATSIPEAPAPAAPATPAAPAAAPQVDMHAYYTPDGGVRFSREAEKREVQSFDGFLLAADMGPTSISSFTPKLDVSGLGPIAVLDEPSPEPAGVEFPELSLNGPSTAQEGFFGLSGRRLA